MGTMAFERRDSTTPSIASVPPLRPSPNQNLHQYHYRHRHPHQHDSMMRRPQPQPLAQHYHGDPDGCFDPGMRTSFRREEGWVRPGATASEDFEYHAHRSVSMDDTLLAMATHDQSGERRAADPRSRPPAPEIVDGRRSRRGDEADKTGAMAGDDDDDFWQDDKPKHLSWKQRMQHVTWAWFTVTMATGGIASVINNVPYSFPGLYTIGIIFFLLNIVLYLVIWAMIIMRFTMYPWTFRASFTHPTESLFAPAFAVSFGTILINIVQYGFGRVGEWLNRAVLVLFWFDCGLAVVLSIIIYLVLWSTQTFTIARMTPIWIFPAYPLLIIGPHAANLCSRVLTSHQAIRVLVGGFTIQGIGFLVSLTIYSAFVYRLMTQKLPAEPLRPGMFVSVGPSAFTATGTIGMAKDLHRVIASTPNSTFMDVPGTLAAPVLKLVANWMSLWLWGLAWWFFFVSLLSNADCLRENHHMPFAMTWFSFIFPQTALTTATFAIAEAFDVAAIRIIGCVMTVLLIIVWFVVVAFMIRAIRNKQILWPEKGEDKSEGGFRARHDGSVSSRTHTPPPPPPPTATGTGTGTPNGRVGGHHGVDDETADLRRKQVVGDAATRNV